MNQATCFKGTVLCSHYYLFTIIYHLFPNDLF